ncbi:MAG: hypothetical protein ABJL71_17435 [Cyclobacteriaceae bacterium]
MKTFLAIAFLSLLAFSCQEETLSPMEQELNNQNSDAPVGRITFKAKEG